MAVIVIGGMITSTVLTLVVVPVSYLLFDRLTTGRSMRWIARKFFGVDPNQPVESLDDPLPAGPAGHVLQASPAIHHAPPAAHHAAPATHPIHHAPTAAVPVVVEDDEFAIEPDPVVIPSTLVKDPSDSK
jgi:hypothetical protein